MLLYKVVECSTVTDVDIEATINEWVSKGWTFDGIQFAMRESSKRPAMAFIVLTKKNDGEQTTDQGSVLESNHD